jgi:DDE superfamily endonuclease
LAAAAQVAPALGNALPVSASVDAPPRPAFDWHALVEPDLWELVPPDVPDLLAALPTADLYVQDEVDIRLHPTLTRCWSGKGRAGQRKVRAPGQSSKVVGFAAVDWRDGWLSHGIAPGRTATTYCQQLEHLIGRSQQRQRTAIVLADNLGIHTRRGSTKLRELLDAHADHVQLVYTPAYDPEANPIERLWPPFRRQVTHNHHRDTLSDLYDDARVHFTALDRDPQRVLRHIGSPAACQPSTCSSIAKETHAACGMI